MFSLFSLKVLLAKLLGKGRRNYVGLSTRKSMSDIIIPIMNKAGIEDITALYFISMFTVNERNLNRAVKLIENKKYKKLYYLLETIPDSFGYTFNHLLCKIYYVECVGNQYFVIVYRNEQNGLKSDTVTFYKEIDNKFDLRTYEFIQQYYPVNKAH